MMYVQFPLSLRNVEDLLHERGDNGSLLCSLHIDCISILAQQCSRFLWTNPFSQSVGCAMDTGRHKSVCSGSCMVAMG